MWGWEGCLLCVGTVEAIWRALTMKSMPDAQRLMGEDPLLSPPATSQVQRARDKKADTGSSAPILGGQHWRTACLLGAQMQPIDLFSPPRRFCAGHRTGDLLQNWPLHQLILVLLPEYWCLPSGHPGGCDAHLEHSSQEGGLHGTAGDRHQPISHSTVSPWLG